MDTELKQKWVEALRSGKYKQGENQLRDRDCKYCCLGVLCDVIDPRKWAYDGRAFRYDGSLMFLPTPVRDMTGIDSKLEGVLSAKNDGFDCPVHSFAEIADYIEANL